MKISGQAAPSTAGHPRLDDRGYILVVLLIAMGVTAIWMSAALPAWRQQAMREKELELIFRGEQYARAIALFQIKNNSYPVDIDILVSQRYLRKKWKDPVTGADFQLVGLTSGQGVTGPPNRSGAGPGTTGVTPNRPGAASPASPTSPTSAGRPGASTSGMGTAQAPPGGGLGRPSGGVPGGQPSIAGQPLLGGITGVRSVSQATSIRVYNGQQQHNLWQFDAAMMMARMGRNQIPGGGGPGRGNDGRGGPARGGPAGGVPGGVPGGRGSGTGPGRGGQLPPPPPPPPGPGRGAGS